MLGVILLVIVLMVLFGSPVVGYRYGRHYAYGGYGLGGVLLIVLLACLLFGYW